MTRLWVRNINRGLLLLLLLSCFPVCTWAGSEVRTIEAEEVEYRLNDYIGTLCEWMKEIGLSSNKRLEKMSRQLFGIRTAGDIYCKAQQELIAADDSLMALTVEFNELLQTVGDSISRQQQRLASLADFASAERFILSQDTVYQRLKRNSLILSSTQYTAQQLKDLKGREQILGADLESNFQRAQEAARSNPSLKSRMQRMQQTYLSLKAMSEEIQAAAYKPLMERLKEEVLSIAAVGIILLLVNAVVTKIQSLKKAKESARKMKELMNKTNSEYPQI